VILRKQEAIVKTREIGGSGSYKCVIACHMDQPLNISSLGQSCRHLSKVYVPASTAGSDIQRLKSMYPSVTWKVKLVLGCQRRRSLSIPHLCPRARFLRLSLLIRSF
jgi:hypothetical protein